MKTERIRVWRLRNPGGAPVHGWKTGPPPAGVGHMVLEIKWALLADEPMDSAGNPPSPGDQLIGFMESQPGARTILILNGDKNFDGELVWSANFDDISQGKTAPSARGEGETVVEAVEALLADAGVTDPPTEVQT